MALSFISCPKLTGGAPSPMTLPSLISPRIRRRGELTMQGSTRKPMKVFNKKQLDDDHDERQRQQNHCYGGNYNLVDENMIVLRMRIKEMKMLESRTIGGEGEGEEENTASDWTEWEKKYFEHYNEDVCEAVGLLQTFLMNTRPSFAVGLVILIATSVPVSASFVISNFIQMVKNYF